MASIKSYLLRFLLKKTINWNRPLNEIRAFQKNIEKKEIIPPGIRVEKIQVNGIESEWFTPLNKSKDKTLIYLHGGGYCLGIVNSNRNFVLNLASLFDVPILLLNYRLAPENPFPAAIEDSFSLYSHAIRVLNIKAENIGFIADSSGCGLTLSTIQMIRTSNLPMPKFLVFMSPVVDLTRSGESFRTMVKKDPFCIKEDFFIDNHYIRGNDPLNPLISPIFGDLSNTPETMIQASEFDVFFSDSVMLREKLLENNIKVQYKTWNKMWHIFQMSHAILPEGKEALKEIKSFIHKQWKMED